MTYGSKASQRGYNVQTCGDSQLLYSSEWPLLMINESGSKVISNATTDITISTHGLGYVPVYLVFDNSGYGSETAGNSVLISPGVSQWVGVNSTALKWLGSTRSAGAGSLTIYYYIFRYNMATSFTAANITTARESAGATADYGIKTTKAGKDISSTDYRDFGLHTNTRSPLVHKTGTFSLGAGGGTQNVTHNLGHEPMFYIFGNLTIYGDGYYQLMATADDCKATATTTSITFNSPYQGDFFYIIFKDPILLN